MMRVKVLPKDGWGTSWLVPQGWGQGLVGWGETRYESRRRISLNRMAGGD